jgi:pilus assembly protein CpaE
VQTKSGVQLLGSSERSLGAVDLRRANTLLQFATSNYRYTLLDVPRSEAAAIDTLDHVSAIVIVANQELATVRNAGRMAAAFRQRFGKDRIRVILTRYDRLADIGAEDVERVVGSPVRHTVPSDYRLALQALNKGRPLTLDGGNKLGEAFKAIAHDLGGISIQRPADEPRTGGLLGRITGRR